MAEKAIDSQKTEAAAGALRLPAIISDNMLLQQKKRLPIWGWASPGEHIAVSLGDGRSSAIADGEGRWKVELAPMNAGGPFEMTVAGKDTITVHNVLVGEVWVCTGQSNMAFPMSGVQNATQEIAAANYSKIRLFTVESISAARPQPDTKGEWVESIPQTVPPFSAVGFFFARELQRTLGVPVGMISIPGSDAEALTRLQALEAEPSAKPALNEFNQAVADYPRQLEEFQEQFDEWKRYSAKAAAEGNPVALPPSIPSDPRSSTSLPGGLFNGMVAPIIPYVIMGVLWYQGEANTGVFNHQVFFYQPTAPPGYRKLFPDIIRDWRRAWGQGDFPFLFVQLTNFRQTYSPRGSWAAMREAQLMTLSVTKTGMAVAMDVGEPDNLHPPNKQEVGHRLALAAEAIAYGRNVAYSGPIYESMRVEGDKVQLRFKHTDRGLTSKGGEALQGFEIAGEDRKFVVAEARISGDTVVVSSPTVPHPAAVRYAWADSPMSSLYNGAGLPASPFRTDDWPDVDSSFDRPGNK